MIKAAVFGYGNVGKAVVEAIMASKDFTLQAIVSRRFCGKTIAGVEATAELTSPHEIDVAILAVPSRKAKELAKTLLKKGVRTVDSFDIHSEILQNHKDLGRVAKENNAAAIIAAGWDPGTDSIIRTLFQAMAPKGITSTNFGPGMSMGHSVAVKNIEGVEDALSITLPKGSGIHSRHVYVQPKAGYDFNKICENIKADDYFMHDETHITQVADVSKLLDVGHGVHIERKGVSGAAHNQLLSFDMKINNPALTAQILVCSARAVMKQQPGCYTLIEIPPVDFLEMQREEAIKLLV